MKQLTSAFKPRIYTPRYIGELIVRLGSLVDSLPIGYYTLLTYMHILALRFKAEESSYSSAPNFNNYSQLNFIMRPYTR